MKKIIASLAFLIAVPAASLAAPMAPSSAAPQYSPNPMIEQVHGCHRSTRSGAAGWHRHVGRNCARVQVGPRRGWRGRHCRTSCRYIGPIKTCRRVCR